VSEGDVPDATQQVFIVAARKNDAIDIGSERQFLFRTAMRIASTQRRTRRRQREVSDEWLTDTADAGPGPDEHADESYRRRLLDQLLETLPLKLRAALVLIEIEELTMAEAAELLKVPAGTMASRLRRARNLFNRAAQELRAREGI